MVGEIIGQYEVLRTLGEGGIARVYLVKHRKLGTRHALKILHYRSDVMAKRLLQEGRIQAQLRHPNIVAVTDVIEADGQVGLLMEYVDGATLGDVLADGVPMAPKDALPLFRQLLAGVGAAFPASEATGRLRVAFDASGSLDERIATGRALLRQMELEAASTPAPGDRAKDLARQQLQRDMLRLRRQLDAQAQAQADADALRATPLARAAAAFGLAPAPGSTP